MISNQILQSTIEGIKNISRVELCVTDVEGKVLVTTFPEVEISQNDIVTFAQSQADSQTMKNYQFFKVYDEHQLEYVLVVKGGNDDIHLIGKMVTFQIQGLLTAYKERFDKDNFIKNLLLDNLLLVDIYNRAKKLHIEVEARRLVFILETNPDKNSGALESVKSLLGTKSGDFITAVDEKNIIIAKELAPGEDYAQMNKVAATILEAAGRDEEGKTHVAYGTIVKEIKEVSRSYKEARMAMDVGKIFSAENDIYAYSSLGIGRLIYQLPIPLCKMFIKEIFGNKSPDDFDEETLTTINKFFENSLNVSETSRQLYIHRNTLVYRLDKLQKSTGLDLRVFEDAITFKIALMVVKYMKYMEKLDFTILTSISEGQPLSVLESLAARRPCVTTEVGCCRELLEGAPGDDFGVAGFVTPPMYRKGLADAMERMCVSRARRIEMGERGQRRVATYFLHEQMLANYRALYDETAQAFDLPREGE